MEIGGQGQVWVNKKWFGPAPVILILDPYLMHRPGLAQDLQSPLWDWAHFACLRNFRPAIMAQVCFSALTHKLFQFQAYAPVNSLIWSLIFNTFVTIILLQVGPKCNSNLVHQACIEPHNNNWPSWAQKISRTYSCNCSCYIMEPFEYWLWGPLRCLTIKTSRQIDIFEC